MPLSDVKYINRSDCELRTSSCGLCEGNWRLIVRAFDYETKLGGFDIYSCQKCGLGFTNPYPTEDTAGYLYDTKDSADFDAIKGNFVDRIKDRLALRQIQRMYPGDRTEVNAVLDYSTGNGRYAVLSAIVFPNARLDAVDYQDAPPTLIRQDPHRVHYYDIDSFKGHTQKYDLIILRHVLEHNHHPVGLLRNLGQRLTPNGTIYAEVPNLESGCAKVFRKYWRGYYVPRHIFHFTKDSLSQVINAAGLEGDIHKTELPFMGNTVAILTGTSVTNTVNRLFGILLHPLQLIIESRYRSSTCLYATLHLKGRE